jgi:ribosome-associated translation inhibitor RaiA
MRYYEKAFNLRIDLDTKEFELSEAELEKLQRGIDPIRKPVATFPVSDLYITIFHHPRSGRYVVKTSLVLPGDTLFSREEGTDFHPALQRCMDSLLRNLVAYKGRLENLDEQSKHAQGTHHRLLPTFIPDLTVIEDAVRDGDYHAFRVATFEYEEALTQRIGRWVFRYPDLEAEVGSRIMIDDMVEAVFLDAFEQYGTKPEEVGFGQWLESMVDATARRFLVRPDEELEDVARARTLMAIPLASHPGRN